MSCADTRGNVRVGEFFQHDTVYVNFDHMCFSLYGYKNGVTEEIKTQSEIEEWWGEEIEKGRVY